MNFIPYRVIIINYVTRSIRMLTLHLFPLLNIDFPLLSLSYPTFKFIIHASVYAYGYLKANLIGLEVSAATIWV
jgi:hypothetical protein